MTEALQARLSAVTPALSSAFNAYTGQLACDEAKCTNTRECASSAFKLLWYQGVICLLNRHHASSELPDAACAPLPRECEQHSARVLLY